MQGFSKFLMLFIKNVKITKSSITKNIILLFLVIPEVGHFNSSNSLKCGMKIGKSCNRPTLKIFDQKGDIVEEEDITRKDTGKNYIILRNKKTNKVFIYL